MTIGERIKAARIRVGITQKELANRLNVTPALVGQYERDLRNPKHETLQKIADALDADIDYLRNGHTIEDHDTTWKDAIQKSIKKSAAISDLMRIHGFSFRYAEYSAELPLTMQDWIVTAPDGTDTIFTPEGRSAYGMAISRELEPFTVYAHYKVVQELKEHDNMITQKDTDD